MPKERIMIEYISMKYDIFIIRLCFSEGMLFRKKNKRQGGGRSIFKIFRIIKIN